jgi:hypothetical protein
MFYLPVVHLFVTWLVFIDISGCLFIAHAAFTQNVGCGTDAPITLPDAVTCAADNTGCQSLCCVEVPATQTCTQYIAVC